MITFVKSLLKEKLELTTSLELNIERAHRALSARAPHDVLSFPARLRVFYEEETVMYNTAEEATKDMSERGLQVSIVKPAEDMVERIKRLTWRTDRGRQADTRPGPGYMKKLQAFRRTPD